MGRRDQRPTHDIPTCAAFLDGFLLPPDELLSVLAPEGWEQSPLLRVFHPTAEQVAAEVERLRRNIASLTGRSEPEPAVEAEPEERRDPPKPVEPGREVVELLGRVLWDVFSDNHSVVDAEGVAYDLGSFRGSAGFIAESLVRRYPHLGRSYDYLSFYMGTGLVRHRTDLGPVYRWIFGRLAERDCRWIYSFPRIYLFSFGDPERDADPSTYDPSEAIRRELEAAADAARHRELADDLERSHREAVRRARDEPLPRIVLAYRDVFGVLPEGWPHPDM